MRGVRHLLAVGKGKTKFWLLLMLSVLKVRKIQVKN